MPRIEDLPLPAQAELRAKRAATEADNKPRPTLLQRLASVGLGGGSKAEASRPAPRPQAPVARPNPYLGQRPTDVPAARPAPQEPVSEYAKRAPMPPRPQAPAHAPQAPQGLDQHGRSAPVAQAAPSHLDDDQLEIPAFLRRQAN